MERLYRADKRLRQPVKWEQNQDAQHRNSMRTQAEAIETSELLTIAGEYFGKRYSFVLMYRNTPIRLWDFSDHHAGITHGHKHKFPIDEPKSDGPYDVNGVTTSDVNQALLDFLEECNIQYSHVAIEKIAGLDQYG